MLDVLDAQLTENERSVLRKAAKTSLKQNAWGFSSMAADFLRPVGAERQACKAQELFAVPEPLSAADLLARLGDVPILYPHGPSTRPGVVGLQ